MKRIIKIIIAFNLLLFLTACSNKEKIDSAKFKDVMTSKGYNVVDVTEKTDSDAATSVLIAMSKDNTYQVEFFELVNEETAINTYNINKSNFLENKSSKYSQTEKDVKNYSKYTLTSSGKYMVVSRIENTLVYANVTDDKKDEIKSVLKELGY